MVPYLPQSEIPTHPLHHSQAHFSPASKSPKLPLLSHANTIEPKLVENYGGRWRCGVLNIPSEESGPTTTNGGRGDQSSRLRPIIEDSVGGGDPGSCRRRRRERQDFSLAREKEDEVWPAPFGVGGVIGDALGR
ncbi:hypothetical protein LR48_Vigan10g037100 [Vigna angularis]|uniref:Uncharacterized protein n=1 Tax=Phaseolus angularis TaxID=3914 RepID=A0A0L9VIH2_PHAAN|nr:hypothetical protein LR48_Vigan10g037100 [Vigna angularis]